MGYILLVVLAHRVVSLCTVLSHNRTALVLDQGQRIEFPRWWFIQLTLPFSSMTGPLPLTCQVQVEQVG